MSQTLRERLQSGSVWVYLTTLVGALSWKLVPAPLLTLVVSFTEGLSLLMLVPLLQMVGVEIGSGAVARIAERTAGALQALGLQPTLLTVLTAFVITMSVKAWLGRARALVNFRVETDFGAYLRLRLYRAMTLANWVFFTRCRSTDFNHALTKELERASGVTHSLLTLFTGTVMLSVYLTLALVLAPVMTLLVITCGAALSILVYPRTRMSRARGKDLQHAYEQMYAAVGEHLAGMRTSKGLGIESRNVAFFSEIIRKVEVARRRVLENQFNVGFTLEVGSVAILALILYVALEVFAISGAGVLLLLFLFSRLIPRISGLQSSFQSLLNNLPAFDYIMGMIDRCEAAAEPEGNGNKKIALRQSVQFDGVSFSYDGRVAVLSNLDLTIEAGKTTAIVGPSGAGKSSLVDLTVGLISPDTGSIRVDGVPLRPDDRAAWRAQLGYVAQEAFLFHETIRANLLIARPGATETEIARSLEDAAASDFVAALPDGLDTAVGDRGVRLSGGERQRLALARSLIRQPVLLILDEATSSLDTENERRIQGAIDRLRGKTTILVIAHRLSTIRNADVIHVLEGGQLVESGDWDTLSGMRGGRFRALCEAQGMADPQVLTAPEAGGAHPLRAPARLHNELRQGTPAA